MKGFYLVILNIAVILIPLSDLVGAEIKGKLVDETGEPMVGALISIPDIGKHAIAGMNGHYQINNLTQGVYTLTASFIGYLPQNQTVTINSEDQVLLLDFQLQPDVKMLGEITIKGVTEQGTEADARYTERSALNVLNIISSKTIELLPDITVANVVQRVSGVSILRNSNGDPQFAIVRGMDRRYNYTLVNGVKISSPDNKNRYIPLDIFPASLLEKLEVSKALTPGMEGDAIGGVINMVMKNAPEKFTVKGDLQLGYNQINFNRKFQQYDHSAVDYETPYEKYGPKYQAQFSDFSKNNLVIESIQPQPDILSSLSVGNRFFNGKFGVLVAGGYQNAYRGTNSVWFQTITDRYGSNAPSLEELHERMYSTQQTRYAVHTRLDYEFNSYHKLKFYLGDYRLLSYQTRDELISQLDPRYYDAERGNAILTLKTRTRTTDQRILTATLQGEHLIFNGFSVNWSVVKSSASNEEPDIAQFERNTGQTNFVQGPITIERHMPRTWQHNTDDDITGYLNLVFTPAFLLKRGEFTIGGMYRDKNRNNFYNSYSFDPSPTTQTQGIDFDTYAQVTQTVLNPLGSTADNQNYNAHENLLDYFVQAKYLFFKKTQVLGGIRFEHTDQGYRILNPFDPNILPALSQKYVDPLPSGTIKHMLNDKTNLRATYFKGITRPGYFEIVPYYNSNQSDGYPEIGNPDLKRVHAHNFDLRYEYFPNGIDQILIGTFYKKIIDPIEYATILTSTGNQINIQPGNYGTAYNWGIELDYTKYFNRIGIKANYTYTNSQITTTKVLQKRSDPNDPSSGLIPENVDQTRPLQGQAKNIGNLSLLFKDQQSGTNMQLAMVYTGERIENVSPFLDNDSWVKPFTQLDFSAEQKIGDHWTFTFKGQNLLNSPYEVIIKKPHLNPDKVYKLQYSSSSTLIRRDSYLQSYRFGVRFTF